MELTPPAAPLAIAVRPTPRAEANRREAAHDTAPENWRWMAACLGRWALFFPPGHDGRESGRERRVAQAVAICSECPVRPECLRYAFRHRERIGVWGGYDLSDAKAFVLATRDLQAMSEPNIRA